jgi:hypothetical protein
MSVIDFGDAMVETKQQAPGTRQDSIYQFGIKAGSEEDLLQWSMTKVPQKEPVMSKKASLPTKLP